MIFLDTKKISRQYKKQKCVWGKAPNRYVAEIPKIIKSGNVLDIGVGEGRNALFLMKNGFKVEGVDISKKAIEKFLKFAKEKKLKTKGVISDIVDFKFNKKYSIIISVASIHLFQKDKIIDIIEKMQKNTKRNGVNLITVFTKKDKGYKKYPNLYFFEKDELKQIYKNWDILINENYTKKEIHGGPHTHNISVLVARKPTI